VNPGDARGRWRRRAQPLLGTLVEIGLRAPGDGEHPGFDAAFAVVREAQACLSRFEPDSDIARFNALRAGGCLTLRPITRQVLAAAGELQVATAGAFDISTGSSPFGWGLCGTELHKTDAAARLDLGGIGKGHAVDLAVQALIAHGVGAGWVNAGGDLRAFGDLDAPVQLRDEASGGVRMFARLRDGAFATSHFGRATRSRLSSASAATGPRAQAFPARSEVADADVHASVAAPLCLWADALTKVVALSRDPAHPVLGRYDAQAWLH
jgi:thiamine biosynthesis lipoprotein